MSRHLVSGINTSQRKSCAGCLCLPFKGKSFKHLQYESFSKAVMGKLQGEGNADPLEKNGGKYSLIKVIECVR